MHRPDKMFCSFKRFQYAEVEQPKLAFLPKSHYITQQHCREQVDQQRQCCVTISDLSLVKPVVTVLTNHIFREHKAS